MIVSGPIARPREVDPHERIERELAVRGESLEGHMYIDRQVGRRATSSSRF